MFSKISIAYKQYPSAFKVLVLASFIDMLGGFLLMPFFALYITNRFGVGMTQVGILFTIFSAGNIFGGMLGGALADKYGRRAMLLIGLIVSGIGSIFMGLVDNLNVFLLLAAILGIMGSFGGPARQAMVVDLLPENKQAEGFGIMRIAMNLAATVGPIFGGFLASQSYLWLFLSDAISSLITAIIVFIVIPETKPEKLKDKPEESIIKTIIGYKEVLKDGVFILFLSVSAMMVIVYMQMNSTLSVFLRDVHGFPLQSFGFLLSMNAIMVVVFQFWIAKKISKYAPMKVIAIGALFYVIGFGMYGFISAIYLFFVAMIIITIGEMIVTPIQQTAVALFAPEDKRGRYMAMFGFHWAIPNLFGVLLAGLVMESIGPNWVWYFAGILSFISSVGFWMLHGVTKKRFSKKKEPLNETTELEIIEEMQNI
ncbi:MAG: MDR family MFS transporter [Candidatus Thorarchaeota archaeon]